MSTRILVIEDDPSISLGLRMNLQSEGYAVDIAEDGATGLERARAGVDLIVLDLMLPHMNGFEVLQTLREEGVRTPVLVLSARTGESDKVSGLDLGADDYVTKPFGLAELMARIRRLLRSSRARRHWQFGDVKVDTGARTVSKGDEPVELTTTEWDLLVTLLEARGEPVSRDDIFEKVWGEGHHGTRRTIDNFMGQLRNKLESDPSDPQHLLTVRGVGYRLDA